MNFQNILHIALQSRCIFHSEADFQHHLAWHMHKHMHGCEMRLEYPLGESEYCDIVCITRGTKIGVELKYKTEKHKYVAKDGEVFNLKNHGAQDCGRYDFLKDISRLERWIQTGHIKHGYAVFLTNDHLYWEQSKYKSTVDEQFRIHDGENMEGRLCWDKNASSGTMKNRELPSFCMTHTQ